MPSPLPPAVVVLISEALLAVAVTLLRVPATCLCCLLLFNLVFPELLELRFGLIMVWTCYCSKLLADFVMRFTCPLELWPAATCLKLEAWCLSFILIPCCIFVNLDPIFLGAGLCPPFALTIAAYWLFFDKLLFVLCVPGPDTIWDATMTPPLATVVYFWLVFLIFWVLFKL